MGGDGAFKQHKPLTRHTEDKGGDRFTRDSTLPSMLLMLQQFFVPNDLPWCASKRAHPCFLTIKLFLYFFFSFYINI